MKKLSQAQMRAEAEIKEQIGYVKDAINNNVDSYRVAESRIDREYCVHKSYRLQRMLCKLETELARDAVTIPPASTEAGGIEVTGRDLLMYFFGEGVEDDYHAIFDKETDWRYRRIGYDTTTPEALDMIESMIIHGVHSIYDNHETVCRIAGVAVDAAKEAMRNGKRIPKCRLTIEHIDMLNDIREQEDEVRRCYLRRAHALYMDGLVNYACYEEMREEINRGVIPVAVMQQPKEEVPASSLGIEELESAMTTGFAG